MKGEVGGRGGVEGEVLTVMERGSHTVSDGWQ